MAACQFLERKEVTELGIVAVLERLELSLDGGRVLTLLEPRQGILQARAQLEAAFSENRLRACAMALGSSVLPMLSIS